MDDWRSSLPGEWFRDDDREDEQERLQQNYQRQLTDLDLLVRAKGERYILGLMLIALMMVMGPSQSTAVEGVVFIFSLAMSLLECDACRSHRQIAKASTWLMTHPHLSDERWLMCEYNLQIRAIVRERAQLTWMLAVACNVTLSIVNPDQISAAYRTFAVIWLLAWLFFVRGYRDANRRRHRQEDALRFQSGACDEAEEF